MGKRVQLKSSCRRPSWSERSLKLDRNEPKLFRWFVRPRGRKLPREQDVWPSASEWHKQKHCEQQQSGDCDRIKKKFGLLIDYSHINFSRGMHCPALMFFFQAVNQVVIVFAYVRHVLQVGDLLAPSVVFFFPHALYSLHCQLHLGRLLILIQLSLSLFAHVGLLRLLGLRHNRLCVRVIFNVAWLSFRYGVAWRAFPGPFFLSKWGSFVIPKLGMPEVLKVRVVEQSKEDAVLVHKRL